MIIAARWAGALPSSFHAANIREEMFGHVDHAPSFRGLCGAAPAFLVIEALDFHALIANVFAGCKMLALG
jgi:hypothetical protein